MTAPFPAGAQSLALSARTVLAKTSSGAWRSQTRVTIQPTSASRPSASRWRAPNVCSQLVGPPVAVGPRSLAVVGACMPEAPGNHRRVLAACEGEIDAPSGARDDRVERYPREWRRRQSSSSGWVSRRA